MKKINLVAPEVCKGFFGEKRREMVKFIKIQSDFGRKKLAEDLKNGAVL